MPVHNAASERYAYFEHAADLEYVEGHGCMRGVQPVNVSGLAKKRQRGEMGTLGSGIIIAKCG